VRRLIRKRGYVGQISGVSSLFWLHHTKRRLSDYRSARPDDAQASVRTFMGLVNEGVLLTQRGLGACSAAMTESDVDRFVEALGRVLEPAG
jgi:glutamate-1-semialdehyde aminotransferase